MDRNDIASALALIPNADTSHVDARDWYDSYGWHLSTEAAGDVLLQACEYDWLDDEEGVVAIRELMRADDELTADEAEAIVQRAALVRQWAEELEAELEEAVEAYERGDLAATRAALLRAYDLEIAHGDAPATRSLAGELLAAELVRYRVYHAPDGCGLSFCGEYDTLEAAAEAAEKEPSGLPRYLWDTARAAGHCAGLTAPGGGEEAEEPLSWHGESGQHCVVEVTYSA